MSVDTEPMSEAVTSSAAGFGSSPVFDARRGVVVWVGADGRTINELDATSAPLSERQARAGLRQWQVQLPTAAVAVFPRRRTDGYALVTRTGFGYVSQHEVFLSEELSSGEGLLSVAQVDARGRLWAASERGGPGGAGVEFGAGAAAGAGAGAEVGPGVGVRPEAQAGVVQGRLRRWDGTADSVGASRGFDRPTGLGWSPDGSTMYLLDAGARTLYRAHFLLDEGVVGAFETLCEFDLPGDPAGLAVDADGCLWFGVRSVGQVHRIDPDGTLLSIIDVDASSPSGCAFDATGGLYVTADMAVTAAPVTRLNTGVFGVPVTPFAA